METDGQERLNLYQIDMKYIRNLHRADDNVSSVSPQIGKHHRIYVGISVFDKGIITRHLKNGANLHQTTPDRRYWGKLKAAVFARYGRSPLGAALFWLSRRPPADPGHSIRKV